MHPNANPDSKKLGFVRFQANPLPHWGPGARSTAMIGEQKIHKSRRNQGKRKGELSHESDDAIQTKNK
ncbi:hypothetical protein NQ317_007281 [Molorchus minor]|uniref:Uncharacterized protein n=1 Tax=Molorchus minor TaxID=1323400 RepID=A0ABQ9JUY7_9CUCU|nr:hypothetical protein NQ317_007281 [Molorchus minor]